MAEHRTAQRTALVTGASSGIGKATASLLARNGFAVFGTSRNPATTAADGYEMLPLDVRSDASVRACVGTVVARTGRLDVLVNNAGYVLRGAAEETDLAEAKEQLETNFFGAVRMTRAVLPIMRGQGAGTIIGISSLVGLVAAPFSAFYSASKFALEAYSEALRHEVRPFGIRVCLIEPGFVRTGIGGAARASATTIADYDGARAVVSAAVARRVSNGMDPARVAEAVLRAALARAPHLRYRVGRAATWIPRAKAMAPPTLFEAVTRRSFDLQDAQDARAR